MSNAYGVNATAPMSYSTGVDAGLSSVSADSLLAYCQMQLGDLDGQINDQMSAQKTALREREAVQSAQNVLGQFGTAGPRDPASMQKCAAALDSAIAQLPPNDPVAGQLADFKAQMCTTYDYKQGRDLTSDEQANLDGANRALASPPQMVSTRAGPVQVDGGMRDQAQKDIDRLTQIQTGTFRTPNADSKEWQGTTDALATVADDIKSSAEIQMLHLQDLVSQRQQAIQLCTGIMSKTDQTLEDQAKAIGR